jgi:rRNA maturation protein Nop10|tara:strand:+ start:136 stop:258 length:123 start_codon:yes stop_codon:yes gene_type:complete
MATKYGKPTKGKNVKAPIPPKYNMKNNYMREADQMRNNNK